jgi:7-cyano-7-deazaguanine synthase in queuosine biosynthesis
MDNMEYIMADKVVMALSGGMDSGTMLAYLLDQGYEVSCLNFTYGSKHNKYEIECAEKLAKYYNVPQSRERIIFIGVRKDLNLNCI